MTVPFLGILFKFVRCECGLIFQNPMLTANSREHIYETAEYWNHRDQGRSNSVMLNYYAYFDDSETRMRNGEIRLDQIRNQVAPNSRVLDLGCSDGLFVSELCQRGFRASGIDVSGPLVAYGAQRYGVDLRHADFEEQWPFDFQFDAITCYATLSNMINPSRVFANIARYLKPGGHFFFNFGDSSRWVSRILGSRLYLYRPSAATVFSKKTIEAYCQKSYLRIVKLSSDVQIVPLARLIAFFRIPELVRILKLLRLDDYHLRMLLLTGYTAHAVRQ